MQRRSDRGLRRDPRRLVALAALTLPGCYTTLDPTRSEGGGSGGSGVVLPTCSFTDAGASRYTVCPNALPHAAASEDCDLRGASLAAIESAEENQQISDTVFALVNTNVWLGGTRADDLVWAWPSGSVFWRGSSNGTAEAGAFTQWAPGEPNDSSTVTTDPERCMVLTVGNYDWNDRSCSLSLPYVCERRL